MNPKMILVLIAILLAVVVSYWPGAPTLGVSVIVLGVANLI